MFRVPVADTVKVVLARAPDITSRLAMLIADITLPAHEPTPLNPATATEDTTTDT